ALPVSLRVWGLLAVLTCVALVAWLFMGHYTRREHVAGRLVPAAGLIHITTRAAGKVDGLPVAEGTHVQSGQVLATVSGDRSSQAMGHTDAIIAARLHDHEAQLRD